MNTDVISNATEEIVAEIQRLKREKDAVILAHYYMSPDLQLTEEEDGIADFVGDSLGLSLEATKVEAQNIVFCGVRFMAETAKILSRNKNVFIPDKAAGCSLASSITAEDVRNLRRMYPDAMVVAYVNTYAETKAECDICCTSRNALRIMEACDSDTIIFVPDLYMGQNLKRNILVDSRKKIILWHGSCEVHEQFTPGAIEGLRSANPEAEILFHWEVPSETIMSSTGTGSMVGSTNDILNYVGNSPAQQFILASECDFGSLLHQKFPEKEFITPCTRCQYMKKITLDKTLRTLQAIGTPEKEKAAIHLPAEILDRAYIPIKRMLDFV